MDGVLDPDFRDEIKVVLINHGSRDFQVTRGARVAQHILERIVTNSDVVQVERLPAPSRGSEGFGRTGLAYLSIDSVSDEGEPIPDATAHDTPAGSEGSDGVGSAHGAASSEVPPH